MKYYTEEEVISLLATMGATQHALGYSDGVNDVCDTIDGLPEQVPETPPTVASALLTVSAAARVGMRLGFADEAESAQAVVETVAHFRSVARGLLDICAAGHPPVEDA